MRHLTVSTIYNTQYFYTDKQKCIYTRTQSDAVLNLLDADSSSHPLVKYDLWISASFVLIGRLQPNPTGNYYLLARL